MRGSPSCPRRPLLVPIRSHPARRPPRAQGGVPAWRRLRRGPRARGHVEPAVRARPPAGAPRRAAHIALRPRQPGEGQNTRCALSRSPGDPLHSYDLKRRESGRASTPGTGGRLAASRARSRACAPPARAPALCALPDAPALFCAPCAAPGCLPLKPLETPQSAPVRRSWSRPANERAGRFKRPLPRPRPAGAARAAPPARPRRRRAPLPMRFAGSLGLRPPAARTLRAVPFGRKSRDRARSPPPPPPLIPQINNPLPFARLTCTLKRL
ncbi:MAG: hypothetical protein J3K34DRAFT_421588 [Monoraphidium minutum]|nr:MAG: hypothetical protein J3K34DRAFT_421588 [Monoraphidium minutum]